MALSKLEAYDASIFDMLLGRGHASIPSILRTHPDTEERIKRLLSVKKSSTPILEYSNHDRFTVPVHYQKLIRKPRWRLGGFRY